MTPEHLRAIGFSRQKARSLLDLAGALTRQRLNLESLAQGDIDSIGQQLLQLRGVGRWTAEYALLRGFGRLQVFPGDDVGAQKKLARWLGRSRPLDYAGVARALPRGSRTPVWCTSTSCSTAYPLRAHPNQPLRSIRSSHA